MSVKCNDCGFSVLILRNETYKSNKAVPINSSLRAAKDSSKYHIHTHHMACKKGEWEIRHSRGSKQESWEEMHRDRDCPHYIPYEEGTPPEVVERRKDLEDIINKEDADKKISKIAIWISAIGLGLTAITSLASLGFQIADRINKEPVTVELIFPKE